jgi:MFS family permease
MGGEPGMTVVPNLLVTGILTIVISLSVVACAALVRGRRKGRVLILLSVLMLLVGGGFGPPILGILAGVAGMEMGRPARWWRERLPAGVWRALGGSWPWVFCIAVVNGVFLVVGSVVLVYVFDVNNPDLFVMSFFFSVVSLALTVLVGRAYDLERGEAGMAA